MKGYTVGIQGGGGGGWAGPSFPIAGAAPGVEGLQAQRRGLGPPGKGEKA